MPGLTFFGGITGAGRIIEVEAATTYEATINEPAGTSTDTGRATPVLTLVEITGSCPPGRSAAQTAAASTSSSRSRTRWQHLVTRTIKATTSARTRTTT